MLGGRRRENERERTLLTVIREQQTLIRELLDRLANERGQPWTLPPRPSSVDKPEPDANERLLRSTVEL